MTYTNPQTAAALDSLSLRVDAALAAYLTVPEEEKVEALAKYDGLVDKMIEIQDEAIDAGEYKSDF